MAALSHFRTLMDIAYPTGIFNPDRHLNRRAIFKQYHSVAPAEWRQVAA